MALCAGAGGAAAQEYSFREYAQADGLQGLSVNCLYADRQGVVWACTELGLHRYEREHFEQIGADAGFTSALVYTITEDRMQRMWVGASNSLYVGDGKRFTAVPGADGRRLRVDPGHTLAAFGDDIVVLSDKRPLRVAAGVDGHWRVTPLRTADGTIPTDITSITAIGDALWMGCGRQLCELDAQGLLRRLGLADGIPDDHWLTLLRTRDGTLWARGIHHVLVRPAGAAGFSERAPPAGSTFSTVAVGINLVEDADHRVLTRSDTGLLRWEDGHWRVFERKQGLALSPNITALLNDHLGQLWMGTRGRGVQRWLGYGLIQHWEEPQGLATGPTWSILRSRGDGRLYVGSEMGANVLDAGSGRMRPLTDPDGQALRQTVQLVNASDGMLWLGQSSGQVLRLPSGSGRTQKVVKVPSTLYWMSFDDAGTLWIFTTRGVFLLPSGSRHAQPARDLPHDQFNSGGYDALHRFWLIGQKGIYLRRTHDWQAIRMRGAMPDAEPSKFTIDAGNQAWLSFDDVGVWRGHFDPGSATLELRKVDDPLLARVLPYVLRQDRQQRTWVGSSQGLDLWSGGRWIRVTQAEGLLWDDTSESAFFEDGDGSVWIGNSKGVSQILDPARMFAARPLHLQLLHASRAGKTVSAGAQLPWSQQPIEIALAVPGMVGGDDTLRFRYRLEGLQQQWTSSSQAHLTYTLLSPGHYVLEMQALDERQRTRSNVVRLAFTILPPWWRSPLAWLAYVLAAALLMTMAWRWRMKQLLKREHTLARLVAERTEELEHDKRELEQARAALALKAVRDDLTGLLNRAGILDALAVQLQHCRSNGTALAVAMIDLDHFKQVNDQHGHLIGDAVLARVGRRMNANLHGNDLIGRYGGEELLAVLPGLLPPARTRLHALHQVVGATPFVTDAGLLELTASIGVAWYRHGETLQELLSRADEALYRAKHGGRNRVELHLDQASEATSPP